VTVAADFYRLGESHYCLKSGPLSFVLDRLRRERQELWGELAVTVFPPNVPDGIIISCSDFNVSSQRSRQDRAKFIAERGQTNGFDVYGAVESLCQQVTLAERQGSPLISLRDLPRPTADETLEVEGLPLMARHPVIFFGDGGASKSLSGLYVAGRLVQQGHRVGLFDWELDGLDHRDRLEDLFGADMPDVKYKRCDRPLSYIQDAVLRDVRNAQLDYVVFDSIAFACDGKPEDADVAARYFQAIRRLGPIGTLHLAHISKADGSDQKPFGSAFWHNGARATWFMKLAENALGGDSCTVAFYNRKTNLGARRPAVGFEITFGSGQTVYRRVDVADVEALAVTLPLWQRMLNLLKHRSPLTYAAIAKELDAKVDTVEKTVTRSKGRLFTKVTGTDGITRVALVERRNP
jgi:hypothetical protein